MRRCGQSAPSAVFDRRYAHPCAERRGDANQESIVTDNWGYALDIECNDWLNFAQRFQLTNPGDLGGERSIGTINPTHVGIEGNLILVYPAIELWAPQPRIAPRTLPTITKHFNDRR
jgi:hypothetical protein